MILRGDDKMGGIWQVVLAWHKEALFCAEACTTIMVLGVPHLFCCIALVAV